MPPFDPLMSVTSIGAREICWRDGSPSWAVCREPTAVKPNPLAGFKSSLEEAHSELARKFFNWIGPATLAQFQWFSGLGVKAARAAAEGLKLEPLEPAGDLLIPQQSREGFESFRIPREPQYALVSSLDGISHLRRNVRDLVAPADLNRKIFCDGNVKELGGLTDLCNHAILDRGRMIGLWDYDVETESIAWMSFIGSNGSLAEAVKKTERFVRDELGDARSFSLDSPKSRAPRIKALRGAS